MVGRKDIDAFESGGIQSRYDALSAGGRTLVDNCLSYVELVERSIRFRGRG